MKSLKYASVGAVLFSTIALSGVAQAQLKPGTPAYRACLQEYSELYVLGDHMLGSNLWIQTSIARAANYCAGSARLSAQ